MQPYNNIFQSEMQNSLTELQANLKDLKSSREQIQETKKVAAQVIENMDHLREDYESYLAKLNDQIDSFVTTSDRDMRNRINDGVVNMRETSLAILNLHKAQQEQSSGLIESTLAKIGKLSQQYESQLGELNQKIGNHLTTSKTDLDLNTARNKEVIDQLGTRILDLQHTSAANTQELINNLQAKQSEHLALLNQRNEQSTVQMLSQTEAITNTLLGEYRDQMKQMRNQFNHQDEKIRAFIIRFEDFLAVVATLEGRIAEINFPEYFREIAHMQQRITEQGVAHEASLLEIKKEARKNFATQTREAEEALKKQNDQLRKQKNMLVFVIFMVFVLAGLILFKDYIIPPLG